MKVSYCSTCKGRLWQLKLTLNENLKALKSIDAEWIILDYNCPDNVSEVLKSLPLAQEALNNGKLKIYKLNTEACWLIPLAKNLVHSIATGDILFNLDIDNYIGSSYSDLITLTPGQFLWSGTTNVNDGCSGRLGVYREDFYDVGGYNQDLIVGSVNLYERLRRTGRTPITESDTWNSVKNTKDQRIEYMPGTGNFIERYKLSTVRHKRQLLSQQYHIDIAKNGVYDGVDLKKHIVRVA